MVVVLSINIKKSFLTKIAPELSIDAHDIFDKIWII